MKQVIQDFIRDNRCNPAFWLDAFLTNIYTTQCPQKERALENAHAKLKLYIQFLENEVNSK